MRSLPDACKFSILSFGRDYRPLRVCSPVETYNDETRDYAISCIRCFDPNMGGTDIEQPLRAAQEIKNYQTGLKKRVFILTDG